MHLQSDHLTISNFERQSSSQINVLQVYNRYVVGGKEDNKFLEGICVNHVPLVQAFTEITAHENRIDAMIIGPEWSIADILLIKKVTDQNRVPLILHTLKFDWKTKEIAIETGVDEYHIGSLDQHFIKRVKLIQKIKSFRHENRNGKKAGRLAAGISFLKHLLKRLFDIVAALLIIILLFPFLLLVLPAISLQADNHLLNVSKRVGRNYKTFSLYKFNYPFFASDKKTAGIWKLFEKLNLTGLPQIINVLKGDMSFVGCYPILVQDAEKYTKDGAASRFSVLPGIIGLWRLNSSEENSRQYSDNADIVYAMTNSVWLDIRILFCHLLNLVPAKSKQEHERAKVLTMELSQ